MKKGFTLIELLAVIVILAIIAAISIPIVMGFINDSREQAGYRGVELYLDAVRASLIDAKLINKVYNSTCEIQSDGNLDCNGTIIEVVMDKKSPTSGTIQLEKGAIKSISDICLNDKYYNYGEDNNLVVSEKPSFPCTRKTDSNGDDVVTCGSEKFYVISESTETVRMLTAKNLTLSTTNPIQTDTYTPVVFSDEPYWCESFQDNQCNGMKSAYTGTNGSDYYVYDSNSNLYQYVEAYKSTLAKRGLEVTTIELMTPEDLNSIPKYEHPDDVRRMLHEIPDSSAQTLITNQGMPEINSTLEYFGVNALWNYSVFTDMEKAKLLIAMEGILAENGLSNASDEIKKMAIANSISGINSDIRDWLPDWAYNGQDYWAGFTYWSSTSMCYPWKESYDCGASYDNSTYYSLRPVLEISKEYIKTK